MKSFIIHNLSVHMYTGEAPGLLYSHRLALDGGSGARVPLIGTLLHVLRHARQAGEIVPS